MSSADPFLPFFASTAMSPSTSKGEGEKTGESRETTGILGDEKTEHYGTGHQGSESDDDSSDSSESDDSDGDAGGGDNGDSGDGDGGDGDS